MNALSRKQILDALQEIEDLHQDGHVADDIVPSEMLNATGFGHEAMLHEGADAFCPGCRVLVLIFKMREWLDESDTEAVVPKRGKK